MVSHYEDRIRGLEKFKEHSSQPGRGVLRTREDRKNNYTEI